MRETGLSELRACQLAGQPRATQRYRAQQKDDTVLRKTLESLARKRPRFGSPRLTVLVRQRLRPVNHKRVERVYRRPAFDRGRQILGALADGLCERQPHRRPEVPYVYPR
jgi:hypothetical protein